MLAVKYLTSIISSFFQGFFSKRFPNLYFLHFQTGSNTKRLAKRIFSHVLVEYRFKDLDLIAVGHGIVEEVARKIRDRGLLPDEEKNDSYIIVEAG